MRTKNHGWNPSACIFENDKYLKCIADTLVSVYSEIKNAKNNISANVTNTIPTSMTNTILKNVTSNMSRNSDGKKMIYKLDCYILHTVFYL